MNNSIRNVFLFGCFILYSFTGYTQNKTIDSLQKVLATEKEDTNKVNTLLSLSDEFDTIRDYKNIMLYAKGALSLSEKIDFERGTADAYTLISIVQGNQTDFTDALESRFKALVIYQKIMNKTGIAKCYNFIGAVNRVQGNYPEALRYYYNALKLYEELGDKLGIARTLDHQSSINELQNNDSEALADEFAALKACQEIGYQGRLLYGIYNGIVRMEVNQGKLNEGVRMDSLFLKGAEKSGDKFELGWSYFEFGHIYQKLGDQYKTNDKIAANKNYLEAKGNYLTALKLMQECVYENLINTSFGFIYNDLGEISIRLNNLVDAKDYLQKNMECAKESGDKENFMVVYSTLSKLDSALGNYHQEIEDYKTYIVYRDSINNGETVKKSLQLKMQYDSDKKEALEKAEQEKEQAQEERKENLEYLAIVSLIILVLAFLFIATRTQVPLKWIDVTGFVGVLLFFQFLETLLHPTITKYTHGSPLLFMGINIALASSIKPLHHTIEKRLINISHNTTEKRRVKKLKLEEEKRRKAEEQRKAEEESQHDDDLDRPI